MRLACILALPVALSCVARSPEVARGHASERAQIDGPLDRQVRDVLDQFAIPGAAVCLIDDGVILHQGVYGVADAGTGTAVTNRTRFQVASVSKVFTAWAAMALVESGGLELDAPIERFTGGYELPPGAYDTSAVTASRLLSHTAGTSAWGFLGDPWTDDPLPSTRVYLERGGEGGAPLVELEAEPGTRHRYSGGGFTVLQLAVEQASGLDFASFVQRRVFEPLGMTDAGFNGRRGLEDYAAGHDALGSPLPDDRYPALAAAGAYASLNDMIRFVEAHWDAPGAPRGRGALEPASFDALLVPRPEANGTWALGYEVIPFAERDVEGLYGHTGDNPGYHSLVFVHPEQRDALIVLTNGDAGNIVRNLLLPAWCQLTGHGERFAARPVPAGPSLLGTVAREGAEAAKAEYLRRQREEPDTYSFGPRQLDRLAYALSTSGREEDALGFLEFNAAQFPEATLPLESLAERYMELGRDQEAERLCERLIALDPDHERARRWIDELAARRSR